MTRLTVLGALTLAATLGGTAAAAATISGTVAAPDGARLPFAVITIVDVDTGATVRAVTTDLGTYRVGDLPAGRYELRVEMPGFEPKVIAGVRLDADTSLVRAVVLDTLAAEETVQVIGEAPRGSLETTSIRESPARDVGEAMAEVSGVWKLRKGGVANDVVLRGMQSRDLNVLIDGQRVYGACPNHMDPPAFHVDFAEVERIEVGKGPFDVRNQGSLGGVVNIVTRRPQSGWHATPTLSAGVFGFVNPSVTASYGRTSLFVLGGLSYRESGPYHDGNGTPFTELANYRQNAIDSDAFRVGTGWGRASWIHAGEHQLQVSGTRQQADHVLYPYLQMDAVYDDTTRVNVRYDHQAPVWRLDRITAQAYVNTVDHWMTDEYRVSSNNMARAYSMGTMATTRTTGGRAEFAMGPVLMGAEAVRRRWQTQTEMAGMKYMPQESIPDVTIDTIGAYGEYTRPLGTSAVLDVGGRLDHIVSTADPDLANTNLYYAYTGSRTTRRGDVVPSAKARLTYTTGDVEIAGGVGHTARVAEANERFFALRRMGSDWVGNPDLDPARNTGFDVSVSWRRGGTMVSGSAYTNVVDGYITVYDQPRQNMVPGIMNAVARSYANVNARLSGGEVDVSLPLTGRLFLSGDLSYVRGSQTPRPELGILSTVLAETPPLRARVRMRYDTGRLFVSVEEAATADQNRVNTDLLEGPTPGSAITNLAAGWREGPFSWTVGVSNLFDRYHVEHLSYQRDPFRSGVRVPEPGRQVFTNVSWKF